MSWKIWSIKDWNEALVLAVFLEEGRAENTVSRIDASSRFLAKCTKDEDCNPDEALSLFINSFGTTISSIRAKFRVQTSYVNPEKIPSWFATLYLTLLAASADNETSGVGDFRERFSKIVKAAEGHSVDFSTLPRMWLGIKIWAENRSNLLGDCSQLALPDPKREILIGYSKRIAFPAYKDEVFLRRTLQKYELTDSSSFTDIARAVANEIGRANTLQNFLEEFRDFHRLVARNENQQAFDSPFWGAVRDICLENSENLAKLKGKTCLEIEFADPADPQIHCYLDQIASSQFGLPTKELNFLRSDGCGLILTENQKFPSISKLKKWTSTKKSFRESKVGRSLTSGWLIFLPNHLGELTSDGSFYVGGPICLVAENSALEPLLAMCQSLGIKPLHLGNEDILAGWKGIVIPSVSEELNKRLNYYIPSTALSKFRLGWSPPRPRISGGSRFGQMLLLNPASNPIVRMQGAVKGRYRLLTSNANEIINGDLTEKSDGFQIPAIDLINIDPGTHSCEYTLSNIEGKSSSIKILLAIEPPKSISTQKRDYSQWLVDKHTGILSRLGLDYKLENKNGVNAAEHHLPETIFPPAIHINSVSIDNMPVLKDINDIPPALRWIEEALSLRFDNRSSLTFDILKEHILGAAEASGYKWYALRKLLFYGQWLVTHTSRNAPHEITVRDEIEMTIVQRSGATFARLVGMLSRQTASRLTKLLLPGEACFRIGSTETLNIGCIEIQLGSVKRATELGYEIGARLINSLDNTPPLAALNSSLSEICVFATPPRLQVAEKWDWGWSPIENMQTSWVIGEVRRFITGPKAWYWIRIGDGMFAKTDSIRWGWIVSSVVKGRNLAKVTSNNSIYWSEEIVELPASLTRWWMLFGGGCIAINGNNEVVFTGHDCAQSIKSMGWRSHHNEDRIISIAQDRRKLALNLRNSQRRLKI